MVKLRKPVPAEITDTPVRICFERIIPDELDNERHVRRALRQQMLSARRTPPSGDEVIHVARMAVPISKKWDSGQKIRCRFLDGTPLMKRRVEALAHKWEQYCNIKFVFVTKAPEEIRISFRADPGSWSAVGRDALNRAAFPIYQPTMNFGWLNDSTPMAEYERVVLHEFGHALGAVHEHQSPTFDRVWNRAAVLKYFQGPPNYWSVAEIEHNVLKKLKPDGMKFTKFDPKSIMLYAFDARLFTDSLGPTNSNSAISASDIALMKSLYQ